MSAGLSPFVSYLFRSFFTTQIHTQCNFACFENETHVCKVVVMAAYVFSRVQIPAPVKPATLGQQFSEIASSGRCE